MHIIGSRQFGGADQFYVRLLQALNQTGHPALAVTRRAKPVAQALDRAAVEQVHLPLANQWDLVSVWRIRKLVGTLQPDIVQTYMGRATRLTRLSPGGRSVHIARLGGYYKIKGYYEHAHAWIGNTQGVCDYLVRSGLPAQRVFLIGNFVPEPVPEDPAETATLRRSLEIPEDAFVLFTLGRFIDIKGFDNLLDAFATLPDTTQERRLYLVIVGDGPLRNALHEQARQLGLQSKVRWAGWQDRPGPYYHLADAMICPSRHETLGNVILEAWSYKKPVIATTTPGAKELIEDDHDGLLTPCADAPALALTIRRMLDAAPADRRALADAGYAKVRTHHSREAVVRAYLQLYEQLRRKRGS